MKDQKLSFEAKVSLRVVHWFSETARDLPWRRFDDPYAIWIAETMLQQTQVQTVIPYFERFMNRFSTIDKLAAASVEEVMMVWEGLGYYRRARFLHQAAQVICRDFGGVMPGSYQDLLRLPGIGRYSAGAILSIAFRRSTAALDGNLIRVISRLYSVREPVDHGATLKRLWGFASALAESVSGEASREFCEGMMELGALICTPKNPKCSLCPLNTICTAYRGDLVSIIPKKEKRVKRVTLFERVYYVERNQKVWLMPKGFDPKYPDFHRLPFQPVSKCRPDLRYAVTHRDFMVEVLKRPVKAIWFRKGSWVEKDRLNQVLLPAIDRRVIKAHQMAPVRSKKAS